MLFNDRLSGARTRMQKGTVILVGQMMQFVSEMGVAGVVDGRPKMRGELQKKTGAELCFKAMFTQR